MKQFELKIQEKKDFCVCSVLQAIFMKHDIEISQEEIAKNLTKGKKTGYRVNDNKIKMFMKSKGFDYSCFWSNETPFNEPDYLLREMSENNGIVGIRTHAYLLEYFRDSSVGLVNPSRGETIEKNYYRMLEEMGDKGFFGLIRKI